MTKKKKRCIYIGLILFCTAGVEVFFLFFRPADSSYAAENLYLDAVEQYMHNDLSGAEATLAQVLKIDKKFYQADFLLGKVLFFQDDEEGALKIFSRLEKRMPQYTESRIWKIRCLILLGQYDDAEKCLDYELSINPGDWRVYFQYALLTAATGNMEKRLSMLRSAENYLGETSRVYIELSKIWYSLEMRDRAQTYLQKAAMLAGDGALGEAVQILGVGIRNGELNEN
ncbi:hypothetical protein AGMMS50268_25720 [Spirochaetia bacterium]|nr:hypothetical protein AGMMS50268_25720 [Spirochaetia bacterium]